MVQHMLWKKAKYAFSLSSAIFMYRCEFLALNRQRIRNRGQKVCLVKQSQ
jgi:hypothetical protein